LTADGTVVVNGGLLKKGQDQRAFLSWSSTATGQLLRNVTLNDVYSLDTLSMSGRGDLLIASGRGVGNFTFVSAFDSTGRRLWIHQDPIQVFSAPYFDSVFIESSVVVSPNGEYVTLARRNLGTYRGGQCCSFGSNNGVVLLNSGGEILWNYSTPSEWIWNAAVSDDGHVGAGGAFQTYEFDRNGTLLWKAPVQTGVIALSESGQRFIAGHYAGGLFLGDANGPDWQIGVDGHVGQVAISATGETSAAIVTRDSPAVRLLYILDNKGEFLGNYSYYGQGTGNDRLAVAGNGCCVVTSIDNDGIYYLARAANRTATIETTSAVPSASSSNWGLPAIAIIAAIIIGALITVRIVRRRKTASSSANSC